MAGLLQFGLVSPTLGWREDIPSLLLPEAYSVQSENVQVRNGEIHRVKGRNEILATMAGSAPILKYHWFVKSTGLGYLFAFTASGIYKWSGSAWSDWLTPSLSETDRWSVVTFNDEIWATNCTDKILKGDDATALNYALDTSNGIKYYDDSPGSSHKYMTAAKFLVVFERYLIAGHVTEDGNTYPHRLRWCDYDNQTVWYSGDGDYADVEGEDRLTAAGTYRGFLIVFKESSYHQMWLSTTSLIFEMAAMNREVGCNAPNSIVNGRNGDLYFYGSDNSIREIQRGEVSQFVDDTIKSVPPAAAYKIQSTRINDYGELWWSLPSGVTAASLSTPSFTAGSGGTQDDLSLSGLFTGVVSTSYAIKITTAAAQDKFRWSSDGGSNWSSSEYNCTTGGVSMELGVLAVFDAITGHDADDQWDYTATPTTNATVVTYKPRESVNEVDIWGERPIAIGAFGQWARMQGSAVLTWDTLSAAGYTTWDGWGWDSWDSIEGQARYLIDIGADSVGETYSLHDSMQDDSTAIDGKLVVATDLSGQNGNAGDLSRFKRVLTCHVYLRGEMDGTLTLEVKPDHAVNWEAVGTIAMTDSRDIVRHDVSCDVRGRHFQWRVSGSDRWRLVGLTFDFVLGGVR